MNDFLSLFLPEVLVRHIPILLQGTWMTVKVGLFALAIAVILGLIFALCRLSKNRLVSTIGWVYTTFIRGVPDLVLMLLFFYGGQMLLNNAVYAMNQRGWIETDYIDISPFIAGSVTIGFIFGAYMAETFRGAMMAVPKGQYEAAEAYGLSKSRRFFRITFPQMIRHALPGVGNNWQVILKTTALVSILSLKDLVKISSDAAKKNYEPFIFYLAAGALFLFLTWLSILAFKWLENYYSVGFTRGRK